MEKNKGKVQLSDELLDPISGGYEEEGSEEVTGGMIEICRYCGRQKAEPAVRPSVRRRAAFVALPRIPGGGDGGAGLCFA